MCNDVMFRSVAYKQFIELERVLWLNNLTDTASLQMTLFHPPHNLFRCVRRSLDKLLSGTVASGFVFEM